MRSFSSIIVSAAALVSDYSGAAASSNQVPLHVPQNSPREIYIGSDPYNGENCPGDYLPGFGGAGSGIVAHDEDSYCVKWAGGIVTPSGTKATECKSGCLKCPDPPENCSLGGHLRNGGGCCVVKEPCVCDDEEAFQWKAARNVDEGVRDMTEDPDSVLSQLLRSGAIGLSGKHDARSVAERQIGLAYSQ